MNPRKQCTIRTYLQRKWLLESHALSDEERGVKSIHNKAILTLQTKALVAAGYFVSAPGEA